MKAETVAFLNRLNRALYAGAEAAAFSATREHAWPGWRLLLPHLPPGPLRVLDVGCGNGRFGRYLAGVREIEYLGVDASPALLARAAAPAPRARAWRVAGCELVERDPARALPPGAYELVALFGVLHHVPSELLRRRLLAACAARLAPGGVLAATFWRFAAYPRFAQRRVALDDAALAGLDAGDLEPGDRVLRWRDAGLRYCHYADEAELARLSAAVPLPCAARYRADGREGALNDYVLWARP